MKTFRRIFLSVFLLLLVFSCGGDYSGNNSVTLSEETGYAGNYDGRTALRNKKESSDIEKKIIKTGRISFETKDGIKTRTSLLETVDQLEAYVSEENTYEDDYRINYNFKLRVPAGNFDTLLDAISKSANKIDYKNVETQDVTEEFIDVQARLKTKKDLEIRYKQLLDKANSVEEILGIEGEIGNLRAEIESMEGRLKYLEDRVSYSTLDVNFYESIDAPFGFGSRFGNALKGGWSNLLWFLIGVTNLWPFVLLSFVTIFIVRTWRKRKKQI